VNNGSDHFKILFARVQVNKLIVNDRWMDAISLTTMHDKCLNV